MAAISKISECFLTIYKVVEGLCKRRTCGVMDRAVAPKLIGPVFEPDQLSLIYLQVINFQMRGRGIATHVSRSPLKSHLKW